VLIGVAAYLLLNEKSFSGVMARLKRFKAVELKEFIDIKEKSGQPEDEG
jgi:hypothetical protein